MEKILNFIDLTALVFAVLFTLCGVFYLWRTTQYEDSWEQKLDNTSGINKKFPFIVKFIIATILWCWVAV